VTGLVVVSALSFFQCFDIVGWFCVGMGKQPIKNLPVISSKVPFGKKSRKIRKLRGTG